MMSIFIVGGGKACVQDGVFGQRVEGLKIWMIAPNKTSLLLLLLSVSDEVGPESPISVRDIMIRIENITMQMKT